MRREIRLAYRDNDRTPVIFCIKAMAARYYDIDVQPLLIGGTKEYEAALFNNSCDVIIEHLEYLYERAAQGEKITMFCAPSKGGVLELVVPSHVKSPEEFRGKTIAVRASGQPQAITLWLRRMGLEKDVRTRLIADKEVGRWCQWKKVVAGECIATFLSPLYLPDALAAGLTVLPVPEIPIVGHYAQACRSAFTCEKGDLLTDYVKAALHALCLMIFRREEALEIVNQEPMELMKIASVAEMTRQFDSIARGLKVVPYPSPQAIANTYEIAITQYPGAKGLNPISLWDLHWVKMLDDRGFIQDLVTRVSR